MLRAAALVPAYDAERTVGDVVRGLVSSWRSLPGWHGQASLAASPSDGLAVGKLAAHSVIVVDDGSRDETASVAREAGALVVCHGHNRGKGAALRTGLGVARELGFDTVVTVDADGQHPPAEAVRMAMHEASPNAVVLGVRSLVTAGAPRANQISNGISNYFLSRFTGRELQDTQCGLRRYPVSATLDLAPRSDGYAFEAEIILLAVSAGLDVVQIPIEVIYGSDVPTTHFHVARDPAKIIARVLLTLARGRVTSSAEQLRPSLRT